MMQELTSAPTDGSRDLVQRRYTLTTYYGIIPLSSKSAGYVLIRFISDNFSATEAFPDPLWALSGGLVFRSPFCKKLTPLMTQLEDIERQIRDEHLDGE